MEKTKEKELKKQIIVLTKKLSNYEYAIKAGYASEQYILNQNAMLWRFTTHVQHALMELQVEIKKYEKGFSKKHN